MSATTFAGSAQFAVTSILGTGGGAAAAIAAAVLLNARYAPISISVAPLFHGRPPAPPARVTTDRGRVLGAGKPRRRTLRQAHPARGRASSSTSPGSAGRRWACWPATRSATPRTSASTARSLRCSWRCSQPAAAGASRRAGGSGWGGHRARADPGDPGGNADHRRERRLPARTCGGGREHGLAGRARGGRRDGRVQGDRPGAARRPQLAARDRGRGCAARAGAARPALVVDADRWRRRRARLRRQARRESAPVPSRSRRERPCQRSCWSQPPPPHWRALVT